MRTYYKISLSVATLGLAAVDSFQLPGVATANSRISSSLQTSFSDETAQSRRSFVGAAIAGVFVALPSVANAGIDPALLKNLKVEGDEAGTAQRLRQIEAVQRPASDLVNIPFEELPSGVSYREYREGKGEAGT